MSKESDYYRANVPDEVNRRLIVNAAIAVKAAQIESRTFPDLERDAVSAFRRLNFLNALLYAVFPKGVTVKQEPHSGGTHVLIESGAVTISTLTRSSMPYSHKLQPYQKTIAEDAQSKFQFVTGEQIPLANDDAPTTRLYGLLIFGGDYRSRKLTLCRMTFPVADTGNFAPGTIDLLAKYPEAMAPFDDEEYATRVAMEWIEERRRRQA